MNPLTPIRCLALLLVPGLLTGCFVDMLATTAVHGELQKKQAQSLQRVTEQARQQSQDLRADQAVKAYRAEHGSNPPSLEILVPDYLPEVPRRPDGTPYAYDPATGEVGRPPQGVTPEDRRTLQAIENAINQYGQDTGYYPPTLDALAPQYLPEPPRTSAGERFIYNNQNGYVAHPQAAASAGNAYQGNAAPRPSAPQPGIVSQHNRRQSEAIDELGL